MISCFICIIALSNVTRDREARVLSTLELGPYVPFIVAICVSHRQNLDLDGVISVSNRFAEVRPGWVMTPSRSRVTLDHAII